MPQNSIRRIGVVRAKRMREFKKKPEERKRQQIIIGNPGHGDCALYAFIIGIMPYLQRELPYGSSDASTPIWNKLSPHLRTSKDLEKIKTEIREFNWLNPSSNLELLKLLQSAARRLLCDKLLSDAKQSFDEVENFLKGNPENFEGAIGKLSIHFSDIIGFYVNIVEGSSSHDAATSVEVESDSELKAKLQEFANLRKTEGRVEPKEKIELIRFLYSQPTQTPEFELKENKGSKKDRISGSSPFESHIRQKEKDGYWLSNEELSILSWQVGGKLSIVTDETGFLRSSNYDYDVRPLESIDPESLEGILHEKILYVGVNDSGFFYKILKSSGSLVEGIISPSEIEDLDFDDVKRQWMHYVEATKKAKNDSERADATKAKANILSNFQSKILKITTERGHTPKTPEVILYNNFFHWETVFEVQIDVAGCRDEDESLFENYAERFCQKVLTNISKKRKFDGKLDGNCIPLTHGEICSVREFVLHETSKWKWRNFKNCVLSKWPFRIKENITAWETTKRKRSFYKDLSKNWRMASLSTLPSLDDAGIRYLRARQNGQIRLQVVSEAALPSASPKLRRLSTRFATRGLSFCCAKQIRRDFKKKRRASFSIGSQQKLKIQSPVVSERRRIKIATV